MNQNEKLISSVPAGGDHLIEGDRQWNLPSLNLEILTTRKIDLTIWQLRGLNDPFWRLYLPLSGHAEVSIRNLSGAGTHVLEPGRGYLIPPHSTIFSDIVGERFVKWYVHFTLGQKGDRAKYGLYPIRLTAGMRDSIQRLENHPNRGLGTWSSARLVGEALERLPETVWAHGQLDSRVELALDFMYLHLNRKISSEEIAEAARVSVRNLNHLFQQELGVPPKNALIDFRLGRACRLLRHTDLSIDQIAEACGFPNRYYFSRIMKQVRSISPAAYRQQSRRTS